MAYIRNVPEGLHNELKRRAARSGRSSSDYLLSELTELVSRPTLDDVFARIDHREPIEPSEPTAAAALHDATLEEIRDRYAPVVTTRQALGALGDRRDYSMPAK